MPSPNPTTRRQYSETAVPTTLASAIVGAGDGTFVIASAAGWPDGSVGNFIVTIDRGGLEERVLCSGRTGTTVTAATRGFNGTTAQAHAQNVTVECTLSAFDADEWNQHTNATSAAHGATSQLVGVSDSQTLTNKTISGASNTISGIAQSASHGSPDTDSSTSALHHTIGTGANQSAAGNHTHTDITDTGWTTYTPTWTAATTNPTLGDGVLAGRYKQVGKTVFVEFYLKFGAATDPGSGNWAFALPVAADTTHVLGGLAGHVSGLFWAQDVDDIAYMSQAVAVGTVFHVAGADSTGWWHAGAPFTWAVNDNIRGSFFYEAA